MNKNINKLPVEIILKKLEMLDYDSLTNVCSIDRRVKAICDHHENYLYEKMILRDFDLDLNKPKNLYVLFNTLRLQSNTFFDKSKRQELVFHAIKQGKLARLKTLLPYVNINVKDNYGNTPLIWALSEDYPPEMIRLLLDLGADVNVKNGKRQPLTLALEKNYPPETITLLKDRGAK